MKNLKYLLITLLLSSHAGVGFGQYSANFTTNGTSTNFSQGNISGIKFTHGVCASSFNFPLTFTCSNYYQCDADFYYKVQAPLGEESWLQRYRGTIITLEKYQNNSWTQIQSEFIDINNTNMDPENFIRTWNLAVSNNSETYRVKLQNKFAHSRFQVAAGYIHQHDEFKCPKYENVQLKHLQTSPNVTASLVVGNQSFNPNPSGADHRACGSGGLILTNISAVCHDEWFIQYEEEDLNGNWTSQQTAYFDESTHPLGSTQNVTNLSGLNITPFRRFRVLLKVAGNYQWSNNSCQFHVDHGDNYTPNIITNVTNDEVCYGSTVNVSLDNFEAGNGSILWSTGQNLVTITPQTLATTTYSVTYTDVCAAAISPLTLTVNPLPTATFNTGNAGKESHCVGDGQDWSLNPNLNSNGLAGLATWTWPAGVTGNGGNFYSSQNPNIVADDYTVIYLFEDVKGCEVTADFDFEYFEPSTINPETGSNPSVVTDLTCFNSNDGIFNFQVSGYPYNAQVSLNNGPNGSLYRDYLAAGDYNVQLTDGNGCVTHYDGIQNPKWEITQPSEIMVNVPGGPDFQPACFGEDVLVEVDPATGGTSPYTYSFDYNYIANYATNFSGDRDKYLSQGFGREKDYRITVRDANGCTNHADIEIKYVTPLTADIFNGTLPSCVGPNDGSVILVMNGGMGHPTNPVYHYSLAGVTSHTGTGNGTVNNTSGGNYTLGVTDMHGCSRTFNKYLNHGSSGMTISSSVVDDGCFNIGIGAITTNTPGANSFTWSNGATTPNISNLSSGNYTITTTDGICQEIETYTVNPGTDTWHKTTDNSNDEDEIIKTVTDPATNDVYVLGNFKGTTSLDGTTINASVAGTSGVEGIFVAKYDECGTLIWHANSEEVGTAFAIKGVDIQVVGAKLRLYFKFENNNFPNVKIKSSNLNTPFVNVSAGSDVVS